MQKYDFKEHLWAFNKIKQLIYVELQIYLKAAAFVQMSGGVTVLTI